MSDYGASTPWQIALCLQHGFRFQPQGDGKPTLFGVEFFAHINQIKDPATIREWSRKRNMRHKKIAEVMMTEADFAAGFQWINGTNEESG